MSRLQTPARSFPGDILRRLGRINGIFGIISIPRIYSGRGRGHNKRKSPKPLSRRLSLTHTHTPLLYTWYIPRVHNTHTLTFWWNVSLWHDNSIPARTRSHTQTAAAAPRLIPRTMTSVAFQRTIRRTTTVRSNNRIGLHSSFVSERDAPYIISDILHSNMYRCTMLHLLFIYSYKIRV